MFRTLILCLLFSAAAHAQENAFQAGYQALLDTPGKELSSYRKLRDAYTLEPGYNPGYARYESDLRMMGENYYKGDYAKSIKYAKRVLATDACNTSALSALGATYKAMGKKALAEKYTRFYNGLAMSVIKSGEFGNPKKPFHVITEYEIYAIVDYLDMKLESMVPVTDATFGSGLWVYVLNKEKKKGLLYFEINKIEEWKKRKRK